MQITALDVQLFDTRVQEPTTAPLVGVYMVSSTALFNNFKMGDISAIFAVHILRNNTFIGVHRMSCKSCNDISGMPTIGIYFDASSLVKDNAVFQNIFQFVILLTCYL